MVEMSRAFSSFAVDDVERARSFYAGILGFDVVDQSLGVEGADVPRGISLRLPGGGDVLVYPRPGHRPADFTVLNLIVADIDQAVDELTARGVTFEQYEAPETDQKGIHRDPRVNPVAWFRDPAGNILAVAQA